MKFVPRVLRNMVLGPGYQISLPGTFRTSDVERNSTAHRKQHDVDV